MKLRTKIALSITILVIVLLSSVTFIIQATLSAELLAGIDQSLKLSATQLVAMVEIEDGRLHLEERDDGHMNAPLEGDDILRLVSVDGNVIDSRGVAEVAVDMSTPSDLLRFETLSANVAGHTTRLRLATIPVYDEEQANKLIAYLQVGKSLEPTFQALRRTRNLFALLLPICFILAGMASYILATRALAPIEKIRLEAANTSIERLNDGMKVEDLPDDEAGRLARPFDAMLKRIGASFFRQKRFTADASHELRTPLSIIRGISEVALSKPRTEEEYTTALQTILKETGSMTRLIGDLLFLARSDSDRLCLEIEEIDLQEFFSAIVEDYFSDTECSLDLQLEAQVRILMDKDRFLQVVMNLLDNCKLHAPESDVKISGIAIGETVQITVSDNGPGIEPHHLAHLTERFYRVDSSRKRDSFSSSGLGLAIALEIMQAHGGDLKVGSVLGEGTTVVLEIPRA